MSLKKTILPFILFLITINISAQEAQDTIKRDLGYFNYLKVYNGIRVTLEQSDVSEIHITGKKKHEVMFKNISGKLKISMKFPKTFNSKDVDVLIKYKSEIEIIDSNEKSVVTVLDTIQQNGIELKTQEGAVIKTEEVIVKRLRVKAISGGEVKIKGGSTDNQIVDVGIGSVYKGYHIPSKQATVTSSSSSLAEITVEDFLDAEVRMGGSINYRGEPTTVKTNKILGGTINKMDE